MIGSNEEKKALLIILDGWGHGRHDETNAIFNAKTPFVDGLYKRVPNAELRTDGEHVGLPPDQMGNSEVGHLNIGAGRIVFQDLAKINKAIESKSFFDNLELLRALSIAKDRDCGLHLIGLLSDGGIHSSQDHLHAILDSCVDHKLDKVFIHAFTDGRDTDPHNGKEYIAALNEKMQSSTGQLSSVIGRYFAMDRDHRWERTKVAYDLIVNGVGKETDDILAAVEEQYEEGVTDEFLNPIIFRHRDGNKNVIKEGDVVICFNFRTDRCRQISTVLSQKDIDDFYMRKLNIEYFTMTRYDHNFTGIGVFYDKDNLTNTLGEVIATANKTQVRIAETEKYPHVTFFFSGGREVEFRGENRVMVNSPKVATYDLKPEMSANELTTKAIDFLTEKLPHLAIVNFANPDMVGHTGVVPAIIKAVETADQCCQSLSEHALSLGYEIIIIADHGNAELNFNPDGSPHTSHTTNPVPVFYLGSKFQKIKSGILADVAPTLLNVLGLNPSKEMTGQSLIS